MSKTKFDVVFYFGDPEERNSLYQLKQWIQPLQRLAKHCGVAVVTANPKAAKIAVENRLPNFNYRDMNDSLNFVNELEPKIILYPNQFFMNFPIWGYLGAAHIFVSHGESDKTYMSQNSLQFFDYVYTAGNVAKMRIREHVPGFSEKRCVNIGRPQLLDTIDSPPDSFQRDPRRSVILYAPTWEGGLPQNRYGSVQSHGLEMVRAILSQGDKYQLIFKPHPFTGSIFPEALETKKRIGDEVKLAGNGHLVDDSPFGWQPKVADLMITDVSAVAYDWLATGKPILITKPVAESAELYSGGILGAVELINSSEATHICDRIDQSLKDKDSKALFDYWSSEYFESARIKTTGEERFVFETLRILAGRKQTPQVIEKVKVKSSNNKTSIRRFILKNLSPTFKIRMTQVISGSLNWPAKGTEIFAMQLSTNPVSKQLLEDLCSKGTTLLLVASFEQFIKAQLIKFSEKGFRGRLRIRYSPSAKDVVAHVNRQKPMSILYVSHGAMNHFGMRLNGINHVLYKPEKQSRFQIDHNLIAYNEIITADSTLKQSIEQKVSRPEGWNITLAEE